MKIKKSNKAKHRFFAEKDICFMQLEYYNLCKYVRSEQMQIIFFFNSLFNNEENHFKGEISLWVHDVCAVYT